MLLYCYLRLLLKSVSAAIDIGTVPFKKPLEHLEVFVISVQFFFKKLNNSTDFININIHYPQKRHENQYS